MWHPNSPVAASLLQRQRCEACEAGTQVVVPTCRPSHRLGSSGAIPGGPMNDKQHQAPAVPCYLCGNRYNVAAIAAHMSDCYTRRVLDWEITDPAERGPKPVAPADVLGTTAIGALPPSTLSALLHTASARGAHDDNPMPSADPGPAPRAHPHGPPSTASRSAQRRKKEKDPSQNSASSQNLASSQHLAPSRTMAPPPPGTDRVTCYLCGYIFAVAFIRSHMSHCYTRRVADWDLADPTGRGPRPLAPAEVLGDVPVETLSPADLTALLQKASARATRADDPTPGADPSPDPATRPKGKADRDPDSGARCAPDPDSARGPAPSHSPAPSLEAVPDPTIHCGPGPTPHRDPDRGPVSCGARSSASAPCVLVEPHAHLSVARQTELVQAARSWYRQLLHDVAFLQLPANVQEWQRKLLAGPLAPCKSPPMPPWTIVDEFAARLVNLLLSTPCGQALPATVAGVPGPGYSPLLPNKALQCRQYATAEPATRPSMTMALASREPLPCDAAERQAPAAPPAQAEPSSGANPVLTRRSAVIQTCLSKCRGALDDQAREVPPRCPPASVLHVRPPPPPDPPPPTPVVNNRQRPTWAPMAAGPSPRRGLLDQAQACPTHDPPILGIFMHHAVHVVSSHFCYVGSFGNLRDAMVPTLRGATGGVVTVYARWDPKGRFLQPLACRGLMMARAKDGK